MTGRYGRTELYTAHFPVRQQAGGSCTACSMLYAMEMVGMLTNQPVVQLSQLHRMQNGYSSNFGVCAEHLWPATLCFGAQQWLTGVTDSQQELRAYQTPPDVICSIDEPNHRLLEDAYLPGGGTQVQIMAAIDSGYAMTMFVPPNHMEVVWDYDAGGVLGLDSRSSSPYPAHTDWPAAVGMIQQVIKRVLFTGIATPPRINPWSPNNNPSLLQAMRLRVGSWNQGVMHGQLFLDKINALSTVSPDDIAQLRALIDSVTLGNYILDGTRRDDHNSCGSRSTGSS
jgi:hypothetical protein